MRKFLLRFAFFLAILFILDRGFLFLNGEVASVHAVATTAKIAEGRKRILSGAEDKIIILGSSRGQLGIDADYLTQAWQTSVYNHSYSGGMNPEAQLKLLEFYLAHSPTPDRIIYAIDVNSLDTEFDPYYLDLYVRPWLWEIKSKYAPAKSIAAYRFSGSIAAYINDILHGEFTPPRYRPRPVNSEEPVVIKPRGWTSYPSKMSLPETPGDERKNYFIPLPNQIHALQQVVELAATKGIKLTFIQIPESSSLKDFHLRYDAFDTWMQQFAAKHRLAFYNFNDGIRFENTRPDYFCDVFHLNSEGATKFTEVLGKTLKLNYGRQLTSPNRTKDGS